MGLVLALFCSLVAGAVILSARHRVRPSATSAVFAAIALTGAITVAIPSPARAAATTCFGSRATRVGTAGDDVISGTNGNDVIAALDGNDVVLGLGGSDKICGGAGNDILDGGRGNDMIGGGSGAFDIASFLSAPGGVRADLPSGAASGDGNDKLYAVEGLAGGPHNDRLQGDRGTNLLVGGQGNDRLDGRGGVDFVGFLTFGTKGVVANLASGRARGQGNDVLLHVEGLLGSDNADTLTGSTHDDLIAGGNGGDTIHGAGGDDLLVGGAGSDHLHGAGGNDEISPGPGNDIVDGGSQSDDVAYSDSSTAVNANLNTGVATGHGTDHLTGVESVRGSNHDDHLTGNGLDNHLSGLDGRDVIDGAAGNDVLQGGRGIDTLSGGFGTDACVGGETLDACEMGSSIAPAADTSQTSKAAPLRATPDAQLALLHSLAGQQSATPRSARVAAPLATTFAPDYGPVYCPYEFDSHLIVGPGNFALSPGPGQRIWYKAVVFYRTLNGADSWSDNPSTTYWFYKDFDSGNNWGYNFLVDWTNLTDNAAGHQIALNLDPGYFYAVAEQWFLTPTGSSSVIAASPYRWDNGVWYSFWTDTQNQVKVCKYPID